MSLLQLLFLDISGGEFIVILIAIFLIFGPKKMPEIARKIGRTMNELKKASSDLTREFRDETNVIKNEILAARESIRRESDSLGNDFKQTFENAGKTVTDELKEPGVETTPPPDPYLRKNDGDTPTQPDK